MSTYAVVNGDNFGLISRKVYGEESKAALLARVNPGIVEPLSQGTIINVPADPTAPQNQPQQLTSNDPSQVTISIRDTATNQTRQFTFWESVTITRSIDSMSTIAVRAPFEPDNQAMRDFFRPFTFHEITVSVGGNPLFIGTIIDPVPQLTEDKRRVQITAYALPGILADCHPSVNGPITYEGANLEGIATDMAKAFGIRVQFLDPPGDVFELVTAKPTTSVLSFLQELAKQRNLVIGDTRDGWLLFQRSTELGFPVARLEQGKSPLSSVTPKFNGQKVFSTITGIGTIKPGDPDSETNDGSFTVQTGLPGGRTFNFIVKDTEITSLEDAVNAKVGRMYGNMATYTCKCPTWFDPLGTVWTPNTSIKLLAPGAMIYSEYEFIVRNVQLIRSTVTEMAILNLVLPGSFSGQIPESLPWD